MDKALSSGRAALPFGALHAQAHSKPGRSHMDQQRFVSSGQGSTSGDSSKNLSSRGKPSTREWQHQWRHMRSERERMNRGLPKVDWSRYHLQVAPRFVITRPPLPILCCMPMLRHAMADFCKA